MKKSNKSVVDLCSEGTDLGADPMTASGIERGIMPILPNAVEISTLATVSLSSVHPRSKLRDGSKMVGSYPFAFHTLEEDNPWIRLDLGSSYLIRRIVVHNRNDQQSQRANVIHCNITNEVNDFNSNVFCLDLNLDFISSGKTASITDLALARHGRFIVIQLPYNTFLHFADIEVWVDAKQSYKLASNVSEITALIPDEALVGYSNGISRFVIASRTDRLGARISAFFSAWRFARKIGAKTILHWKNSMIEMYGPDYKIESIVDLDKFYASNKCNDCFWVNRMPATPHKNLAEHPNYDELLTRNVLPEDFQSWPGDISLKAFPLRFDGDTDDTLIEDFRELAVHLLPTRVILDEIASLEQWIGVKNFVAIHVRRGDIIEDVIKVIKTEDIQKWMDSPRFRSSARRCAHNFTSRIAGIDTFRRAANEFEPGTRFLIFGESQEECLSIAEVLPKEGTYLLNDYVSAHCQTPLQRAFFEIQIMARATVIIGGSSSFSGLALIFGKAKMKKLKESRTQILRLFDEYFAPLKDTHREGFEYVRSLL